MTYISDSVSDQRVISRNNPSVLAADDRIISPELVKTLALRRLVIAMDDEPSSLAGVPSLSRLRLDVWHNSSHTVRILDLRNMRANTTELLQLIRGFDSVEKLVLQSIVLCLPRGHNPNGYTYPRIWLSFCLDLRKTMQQSVKIELGDLRGAASGPLPVCAAIWIQNMAIPPRAVIDFEREERLMEDFDSFLPMWAAEEEMDRGKSALEEWKRSLGRGLCDSAMSRRWW